jgi:hypothetical protein
MLLCSAEKVELSTIDDGAVGDTSSRDPDPDPESTSGINSGLKRETASSIKSVAEAPPRIFSKGTSRLRFLENHEATVTALRESTPWSIKGAVRFRSSPSANSKAPRILLDTPSRMIART